MLSRCAYALLIMVTPAISAQAQQSSVGVFPIEVPLTVEESAYYGTYSAKLQVGIGSLPALSMTLDTGSVALVVFANPGIPGNGTWCSAETHQISYGNPLRVTYSGVICYGPISIGGVISTRSIPFALMTSTIFCAPGFHCKTPQQNYEEGNYGVFGAGISPGSLLPNALRALDGPYGKRFMVRLSANAGERSSLILAPTWRYDAAIFPQGEQSIGALKLRVYKAGRACVLLDSQQTSVCPKVTFDTGNGVPFFHAFIPNLHTVTLTDGHVYVAPGTRIGFSPRIGGPPAFTLLASDRFAGEFRYDDQREDLINVGIQALLGEDVIFDGEQGVITVAPTLPDW
jgi:hypothetical protein